MRKKRDLIFEKDGLVLQNMISNKIMYFVLIKKLKDFDKKNLELAKKNIHQEFWLKRNEKFDLIKYRFFIYLFIYEEKYSKNKIQKIIYI